MLSREVLSGRYYMLLRHERENNNIFLYMVAVAAARFGIVVPLPLRLDGLPNEFPPGTY